MEAHERSFSFMKTMCFYDIPFFQRNYVWDSDNWSELFSNLLEYEHCPFLGSIILKSENTSSGDIQRFIIIDGQQRLTTLSILLRACFDRIMENKDQFKTEVVNNFISKMQEQLFVTVDDFTGEKVVKIQHSHIDRPSFEAVIKGELSSQDVLSSKKAEYEKLDNIQQCYIFFRDELSKAEISFNMIQKLWKLLTQDNEKYLVNIDLQQGENEQAIFDTVNTAGVRLTCADTIKNVLFQKYIDLLKCNGDNDKTANDKAVKLYNEHWDKVFSGTSQDTSYWNKQRQIGRLYRDNIEVLLHCIAVIKGFFNPQDMKMSELTQAYKEHLKDLSLVDIVSFITDIHNYAELFRENIVELVPQTMYSYENGLLRLIHIADTLEITTFHPYILQLLYRNKTDKDYKDFERNCQELEKYLILHAVCKATTKNYNKECVLLIKGEKNIDDLIKGNESITKESFVNGLRQLQYNKLPTLLLFWLELYKRQTDKADTKELKDSFSLEHIMPQKWQQYWSVSDCPVLSENGDVITDTEKATEIRQSMIYDIGNMTLLNTKLNTSLRNY